MKIYLQSMDEMLLEGFVYECQSQVCLPYEIIHRGLGALHLWEKILAMPVGPGSNTACKGIK